MTAKCDVIAELRAKVKELENQLETERMRLAGCGVAALGYFDGCCDEYRSASLEDTLRLWNSYTAEQDKVKVLVDALFQTLNQIRKWQEAYGKWNPEWLPPACDVQVMELAEEALSTVKGEK